MPLSSRGALEMRWAMTEEKKKQKQVVVKAGAFKKVNRDKFEKRTGTVELPELNEFMGLKEGEVAVVKVQQIELSDVLKIRGEAFEQVTNLIDGIVSAASSRIKVRSEVRGIMEGIGTETGQMLDTIEAGILEPKLARDQLIYLEKKFPFTITKIYNKIMSLTNLGATVKKNS